MSAQTIVKNKKIEWIMMIEDLKNGAGYSYLEISKNTQISISEIRKLVAGRRQPRFHVYQAILAFYCKTFYGRNKLSHAANFLKVKKNYAVPWLEEFIFVGDLSN